MSEGGLAHYSPVFCYLRQGEEEDLSPSGVVLVESIRDTVLGHVGSPCELRERGVA